MQLIHDDEVNKTYGLIVFGQCNYVTTCTDLVAAAGARAAGAVRRRDVRGRL